MRGRRAGGRLAGLAAHHGRRAGGIGDDLPRNRADQPALEERVSAVADDDVIDAVGFGVAHDLLGGVADGDWKWIATGSPAIRARSASSCTVVMAARILDDGLAFHLVAELRARRATASTWSSAP